MLLSFSYFGMAQASKDVSFSVDMNGVTTSFTNVYVSGTMNSWSGNANQLTDPDGDGIYEGKIALSPGSYEYKFTYDNWVGQESMDATLDSACTLTTGSFTNRFITIDSTGITNTSFDDEPVRDDNREDWRNSALESHADTYFGSSDYVLQMSTTERTGTWAGKLPTAENSSKPRRWIYQEVAVSPNTDYEILGYIRNKDENVGSTVTFQIYDAPFDSAQVIDDNAHILSSADFDSSTGHDTDVFMPATISFNSGNNDTVVLLISNDYTLNVSGENSESFVDDVTISMVLPTVCWEACVDCSTANAYTATSCGDLFFSEYAEGSSNHKYFEIYNPTSAAISLSGYTVYLSGNGGSYTNTFTTNASIASGDVYMISTNQLDSATQSMADTAMGYPSVAHYNGDDALILVSGTDTIDVIGVPGVDPGSSWSVGTGSTANHTLVRKATIDMGSTDWTTGATEWDVNPQNTWSFAGSHSSNCIVTPKNVTFQVDMSNVSSSFTNVYVSGTVNNWSGNANQLTDVDGDGVYEGTLSLLPGSYEYKFTYDNWTGQESLDATLDSACTITTGAFTNRYATFGSADTTLPVVCWEECISCAPASSGCSELFFSEYSEGSSNNKYIEIYNPTANAVSLSGYTVYQSGNGGSYTNTFTTNATIASGDVYLIAANQADATILAAADTAMAYPSIAHFNGDDAMILVSGTDTIDVIGVPGVDPGSSWTVGTGSTANHTLVRKSTIDAGSTDWTTGATEWDVYAQNTWTYKGAHTSNCVAVQTDFTVTFMVNTANITVGTNGLYLGGGVIGGANAVQLLDPDGDGIYVGTDTLNGSTGGNFIFLNSPANASDWNTKENLSGLSCADPNNYNDRILPAFTQDTTLMFCFGTCSTDTSCSVTATYPDVTFSVDMNNVSASFTNVYVSGTLNNWSGNANQLTDPDGDGVYDADISIAPGNYEFKFTYDNWVGQESLDPNSLDSNCTLTTGAFTNRYVSIGVSDTTLPVYCWEECVACAINVPTYTIDQIDNTDTDGIPDSLNVYCKVIGVVHGVDMQGSATAVSFTVHDGTEGLGTYSSVASVASYSVTEGDEVRIVGEIGHFNGLLQMYVDSITVLSTGNATQVPTVVTSLGEATESELVKFENMTMVDPTQWGSGSSGYNIDITNGSDTIVMRIDSDVDLFGATAPIGIFNVVGIGGQYDFSAPHFDGYQLLPRYQADITPASGVTTNKLSVSEIMSGSNSTAYNADWFEIHNYGDSAVDMTGFSWDDESEIPGTSTFPTVSIQAGGVIVVLDDVAANKDAFLAEWKLYAGSVTIVANDELTGSFPSLSQNGDAVFLYDANGSEIASGAYTAATAGFSVEFDTTGTFLGDAVDGTNGAYTSLEGDVGSPGNLTPNTSVDEAAVISSIYPNPTTGLFTVNLVSDISFEATITNMTGATVFHKEGTGAVLNIDLDAARGTYVLRVRTAQGTAVQMIVLQ